ncbi:MAG: VWA domain-containing protein, partial [Clostridia bacterium]|nr:VWA domain-containing protein [Clostridia bacterium]
LSLKYRKRRIPTSKLRNIIIILCQILILTICAFILARPSRILKQAAEYDEIIAVIDSSASMRAENGNGETRYVRAINLARERAKDVFNKRGLVSVIVADNEPEYVAERYSFEQENDLNYLLDGMINGERPCSYGVSDMEAAMVRCEDVLSDNPSAKVVVFTDTDYVNPPKGVEIVPVYEKGEEWNVAILGAYAEIDENYYNFVVEIASYGRAYEANLYLNVEHVNALDDEDVSLPDLYPNRYEAYVYCPDGITQKVVFRHVYSILKYDEENEDVTVVEQADFYDEMISSYQTVHVWIDEYEDSINETDNSFYIYGGQRPSIKVQYVSSNANPFTRGALYNLKTYYNRIGRWNLQIKEVKRGEDFSTSDYDFYVFENVMPERLPTDGAVFLIDPSSTPYNLGARIEEIPYAYGNTEHPEIKALLEGNDFNHPIMKGINLYFGDERDPIGISVYRKISGYDTAVYKELITCPSGEPALLVKDEGSSKVVIMAFSVHFSNISVYEAYPRLFLNTFNYFFPPTVEKSSYEIGDTISVYSRGESLEISASTNSEEPIPPITEFPYNITFYEPGTYTFSQTTYFGDDVSENVFVNMPAYESNIWIAEDGLTTPYIEVNYGDFFKDLLLYFAIGWVALMFIERLLHLTEGV